MDINLHSFILVVGLIVIIFIVVDGIKKVREARSNQFGDDVLDDDLLESDFEINETDHDEHHFKELEIADDLVNRAFATDLTAESHASIESLDDDIYKAGDSRGDVDHDEPTSETSHDSKECASTESVQSLEDETNQLSSDHYMTNDDPSFESFSASDDVAVDYVDQSALNESASSIIEEQANTMTPPSQPRKRHANQPTKLEVENKRRELDQANAPEVIETEPLLDIPESVPVLMEPVQLGGEIDPNPPVQHEMILPEFVKQTLQDEPVVAKSVEPDFDSFSVDDVDDFSVDSENGNLDSDQTQKQAASKHNAPVGERLSERPPAQEVFVINVLKESGPLLNGAELSHIFNACDMRHGEMDIFHRFEEQNAQGKIQFSVVNALKPGTFDLDTMNAMETKGISLFMSLPGPEDAMGAFDAMAEVALVFARNFGASMYDESHSDLTPQTLEHYRNRIREYSRKQFSKK